MRDSGDGMPTRIAMLRSKSVGGVEPRLDKEARALAEAGYEVHAVLWDRDLAYPETESRPSYMVHRIRYRAPYNRGSLAWKLPRFWSRAFRLLRRLEPHVVHAADYDTVPPAIRARDRWGSKLVFDIWDFYADMITVPIPSTLRRRLARREARAVAQADLVILPDLARKGRLSVPTRRVVEVMNTPEDRTISGAAHDGFVVFYGGNLAKDRGLFDLVRACEATGATLVVAGQGPDQGAIIPEIESSPRAMFLGEISPDEVVQRTASADLVPILYDPSVANNRFASPNKLFEAMMLGKPVLVTDGIGVADLVRSHDIGVVVPYNDRPALQAALEELMLSPPRCATMGANGRRLYESRFRWDLMKGRLLEGYREMLHPSAGS